MNELRPGLEYVNEATWGSGIHQLFTMGLHIDGAHYTGIAANKKVFIGTGTVPVPTYLNFSPPYLPLPWMSVITFACRM